MSKLRPLADENIPRTVIIALREKEYDVASVWELRPGMSDEEVVELAIKESRIIITFDKDFGRIALLKPNITGIILLRIPLFKSPIHSQTYTLSIRKNRKSIR